MHVGFVTIGKRTDKVQSALLFIGERSIQRACPISLQRILSGADSESIEPLITRGFSARVLFISNSGKKATIRDASGFVATGHAGSIG
jgi:hypothetical protein